MNFSFNFFAILVALLLTPFLIWLMRLIALRVGFVDIPNARKIHVKAIPLVGGVVLYMMAVVLLLLNQAVDEFTFYLILSSGILVVVGFLDDLYGLSALWRFIAQIFASLLIIYGAHLKLSTFGFLLWPDWQLQLGFLTVVVTVFGVVGVINAVNMADGIDGLAAMTFFLPVLTLAFYSKNQELSLWLISFLIVVLVFVLFNKSTRFKVFLGDNGSLLLGFILAWLLVYFSQGFQAYPAVIKPVTALYLVALPIFDTIFVMTKRVLSGRSPFKPDKTHLHHMFLALGYSQTHALFMILLCQAALIIFGSLFLFYSVAEFYQFYVFILLSALYYLAMQTMWMRINLRSS